VNASHELNLVPGIQKPTKTGHSPCPGWAHHWGAEIHIAGRGGKCRWGEVRGSRAFGKTWPRLPERVRGEF